MLPRRPPWYAGVMVVSLQDLIDEALAALARQEIERQLREAGIELPDVPTPPEEPQD